MLDPTELAAPSMQQGAALYGQGRLAEAREQFAAALSCQPDLTTAKFNLAVIARDLDQDDVAESLFREVMETGEIVAESVNNLGILASRREQSEEAVAHFREAIRLRPQFPLAHFNLSTVLLRQGNWVEGWPEYEWRWQTPAFKPIGCPQPQWNGERLDGTLLLHTEQGIGDVFQFCRFIPMIRERCRRVMFLRPQSLDGMFPQEKWADEIRSPGEFALDSFDAFLPLMSAPLALQFSADDLPVSEAYLTPQHREVPLPTGNGSFKVGLAWRGSPTHSNDRHRSMDVRHLLPLLEIPGVSFYSLQVGEAAADLACDPVLQEKIIDLNAVQHDFADTAAIVRQLDLVITVDTSVLHLSGGLGLPVWGLISRRADWRWQSDDQVASDWYRSLTLFRQTTLGDWEELIGRVADELKRRVT